MSSDPNPPSADLLPKSMKGKYDGRRFNERKRQVPIAGNDNNPIVVDVQPRPVLMVDEKPRKAHISRKLVKKRYDGRANNGRNFRGNKPGPKPLYLQRKTRNYSSRVLELYDAIATDQAI